MAEPEEDEHIEYARAVLVFLRKHAEELRGKGVPVDDMIRDLERQIGEALALRGELRDLQALDEEFEREKKERRRGIDDVVASLPPSLADGMATIEYLQGIAEREASRVRRGKKGVGG